MLLRGGVCYFKRQNWTLLLLCGRVYRDETKDGLGHRAKQAATQAEQKQRRAENG